MKYLVIATIIFSLLCIEACDISKFLLDDKNAASGQDSPAIPTGLAVGVATETSLVVSWNTSSDADTYSLNRDTEENGLFANVVYYGPNTSYTDINLLSGTTYWYKVKASNEIGESAFSMAVFGITYEATTSAISIYIGFELYSDQIFAGNPYFVGRLIETESATVVCELGAEPTWSWIEEQSQAYWRLEANMDFTNVAGGVYEVLVWIEQDGDGTPYGSNEPYVYATGAGDVTTFSVQADGSWLYGEAIFSLS